MAKKLAPVLLYGTLTLAVVVACGSSDDRTFPDGSSSGSSGSSGESSSSGGVIGSSSGGGSDSGLDKCATDTQVGKQMPLDILIMLDASGSMMGATSGGGTKWAAVKTALNNFITDAKSAGIGVGLNVFPIVHAGAPSTCVTSANCNVGGTSYGKCFTKVCQPSSPASTDPVLACDTAADCPGGRPCEQLGRCIWGILAGNNCLVGDATYGCSNPYKCTALPEASCDATDCFASDYATAKVSIGLLPGNASTLTGSINGLPEPPPNAMTPTSKAIEGGLTYAKQYATANPGHVVVMVLATDGLPTRCTPMDIPGIKAIAAGGVSGSPSVKTFVIGVFSTQEASVAGPNLDQIAQGGGTNTAFIISTGGNVTAQFQAALDSIRGSALPCEYTIPTPESGTADFDKLNVQVSSPSGTTVIAHKANQAACDPTAGGWTYDVDPSTGGMPTKIVLCPASCSAVKQAGGGAKVEVVLGCKTIVQ